MVETNYQPDARCQALYETTQQFLDRIPMEPETLPRYLQMQGRFPQLSVNNAILMAVQYPAATRYRTLADWQTDGVTVKSGQQPISILIPDGTYQRSNGSTATKFAVQQVYDITQTDAVSKPEQADLRQTLHAMLMRPVCPVEVIQRSGGAVFVPDGPKVQIGRRYVHGGGNLHSVSGAGPWGTQQIPAGLRSHRAASCSLCQKCFLWLLRPLWNPAGELQLSGCGDDSPGLQQPGAEKAPGDDPHWSWNPAGSNRESPD